MDVGIDTVSRILCGGDGAVGLRPTLALRPTAAFHGCLLRIHNSYILLRSWGESFFRLSLPRVLESLLALDRDPG